MNVVVVRSQRKMLSLSVNRNAEVVVRAPIRVSEKEITRFVLRHEKWIENRLAEIQSQSLNLSDGEKISIFGEEYRIAEGKAALRNGFLFLPEENREEVLTALLKKRAKREMTERTERIAKENSFSYSAVRISSARGRWGSCSRKASISYSFRIALLPKDCVEYVIVHELCHIRHFNHSVRFWREVEQILPDYKLRRKTLKGCGNLMNFL